MAPGNGGYLFTESRYLETVFRDAADNYIESPLPRARVVICNQNMVYDLRTRLPKPTETQRLLQVLRDKDLHATDYAQLEKEINEYFKIIPAKQCVLKQGSVLYRARRNQNEKAFDHTEKIYIPSPDKIEDYGRANLPGQEIFYGALTLKQAAFEVLQDHKKSLDPGRNHDSVTVGAYLVLEEINLATLIHNKDAQAVRPDMVQHLEMDKKIVDYTVLGDDYNESKELLITFFADQFARPDIKSKEYMFSVFYLNQLLKANEFVDPKYYPLFEGVNYPSVALKYKHDNQAIIKQSADSKLKLIAIYEVICTNFDFETGDLMIGILHDAKEFEEGAIIWNTNLYGYPV